MFVFIAVLTILGFLAGFIIGRKYTESEVKRIEQSNKDNNDK